MHNSTPLFNAVKSGSIEAVDILLTNRARTDVVSEYSGTPLHCASETGNADITKLLITKGKADVNAADKNNRTPLFNAVKSGSIETVDILLTNGARTDVVSKDNSTPLFNAVECCSIEAVDILLTNGARTDVVDKYGDTPLLSAVESGRGRSTEIINLLINKGEADVTAACQKYHINPEVSRLEIAKLFVTEIPRSMSSSQPEGKQLSTSHHDDKMSAELTKESTYRPDKSTTAGQGEAK
uniref:Uncharacterized protein n=1 Tax=Amphimedon queenslandica TaxID=400682 RepID=A0A1X7U8F0_AMPQE